MKSWVGIITNTKLNLWGGIISRPFFFPKRVVLRLTRSDNKKDRKGCLYVEKASGKSLAFFVLKFIKVLV